MFSVITRVVPGVDLSFPFELKQVVYVGNPLLRVLCKTVTCLKKECLWVIKKIPGIYFTEIKVVDIQIM